MPRSRPAGRAAPSPEIGPLTGCAVIVKLRDVISLIPSLGTSRSGHFERGARAEANPPPDTTQASQPPRGGTAAGPPPSAAARSDPADHRVTARGGACAARHGAAGADDPRAEGLHPARQRQR